MAVLMPSALLPRQMRLTELAWLMADHFHQGRFDQLEAAFGKLHREALQLRNDFRKVIGVVD
jgi:hypothetical protein